MNQKIAITGTGYVVLFGGILLPQHNEVVELDIIPEKILGMVSKRIYKLPFSFTEPSATKAISASTIKGETNKFSDKFKIKYLTPRV